MNPPEPRFWQPDVTVATVVARDGYLLMVEEQVDGRAVLNQPAGHLEPDESLLEAALRETREETGWAVRLTGFLGAYQWRSEAANGQGRRHFIRFAFAAEPEAHDPDLPLDVGILRAVWMTPQQIQDAHEQHRSPLVWQTVMDHLAGRHQPLSLLRQVT